MGHWLHSIKAIPPDAYFEDPKNTHGCFLLDKEYVEAELSHVLKAKKPTIYPWYSLGYIQKLLRKVNIPETRNYSGVPQTLYCTWDEYGYVLRSTSGAVAHSQPINDDYHLAALKFLYSIYVKYL